MLHSTHIDISPQQKTDPESSDWWASREELAPDTKVTVKVIFQKNSLGQPFMVVADASCGADAFIPTQLTTDDEKVLRQLFGDMATATFKINKKIGKYSCGGRKYEIGPRITVTPLPLNPTPEKLQGLKPKTRVMIEGTFAGYFEYTITHYRKLERRIGFTIDTPDGQAKIETHYGAYDDKRTTYSDGVIENLQGKLMAEGETVRFTAFVSEDHTLHGGYYSAFLVSPSEKRRKEYDELRQAVALLVNELESAATGKQYRSARSLFAQLRQLELTHDEQRHIQQVMSTLPRHEQSIYEHRYTADDIVKAFGVDVESLNRAQFLSFAFEVVRGVRENPRDKTLRTDQSYLFHYLLMDSPVFTHREKVSVLRASLSARLKRLEGRTDQHDDHWDDEWLLEQTIRYASYIDDPAIVRDIEQLVEYCISMERSPSGTPRRMAMLLYQVLDTIDHWQRRKTSSVRITRRKAEKWRQQLWDNTSDGHIMQLGRIIELLK
jgi:hypothetical protein